MESKSTLFLAKVCLLGNGAVGKTSLRGRFLGKAFSSDYAPTIGSDFMSKQLTIESSHGLKELRLQIWDLAGQVEFRNVRPMYFKRAVGAIIVFDMTREESLHDLNEWMKELTLHADSPSISIIIAGNKNDLCEEMKCVDTETVLNYINDNLEPKSPELHGKIHFLKTSAKTGENVGLAFEILGKEILERYYKKKENG